MTTVTTSTQHKDEYLSFFISKLDPRPQLVDSLNEFKGRRDYNVIYKVWNNVYIHGHSSTSSDGFSQYTVLEPPRPPVNSLEKVEELFARQVGSKEPPQDVKSKEKYIVEVLQKILTRFSINERFPITYHFIRDKLFAGPLEPLIRDSNIEDISIPGKGNVFIVHKVFGPMQTSIAINNSYELNELIIMLSEKSLRPVSHNRPIIDASLPDGSRVNFVFGEDVSRRGSNMTIRKFAAVPISITQLIAGGAVSPMLAAYLWMMLEEGMNIFICGETASGKTTTLNSISTFIPPSLKVITIEDTPELTVPHANWISEVTRDSGDQQGSVKLFDLLKSALRQRPNYILVGEIRDKEGNVAFQAMQTGHSVMATFHAAHISSLVQRLTSYPIEVPKSHVSNLNIALFQSALYDKHGFVQRRILEVDEMVDIDPNTNNMVFVPTFTYDSVTDKLNFGGRGSSHLLENKIAVRRGIDRKNLKTLYEELERRADYLSRLVEERVFDYFDVWHRVLRSRQFGLEGG